MRYLVRHGPGRFCVMLGMALMLVFAGASVSGAVDEIQHAPGASPDHEHMLFSSVSAGPDETHHAGKPQPDQDSAGEHTAGHHHHHGDHGSGTLAEMIDSDAASFADGVDHAGFADDDPAGFVVLGLERPPKAPRLDA